MIIYTQAELDNLTDEEFAQFLIAGLLVSGEGPFYLEDLAALGELEEF